MKSKSKVMKNILKVLGAIFLIVEIIANLDGAISFFNRIGINITDMEIINVAKTISGIFHFFTPFLVIGCIYYIIVLREKLSALKKFRDEDSLDSQRYMVGTVKAMETQIELIYSTMKLKWEKGKENPVTKIYFDAYDERMKKELEEYNKAFSECQPFKPFESK